MLDITLYGTSALVLVGILVEVAKRAGVAKKFVPLSSEILGVVVVCIGTWSISVEGVIAGLIIGAITSGVYDNVKPVTKLLLNK